ncbi:hypothetical protein H6P81_019530 [Aristolochia fimbriata]|uniref:Uncharacterized protein n=1 Tax=Aristolochia fimbriata TaxID=158543 RepID=A0AAV7DRZ0_ARIFI|nr:hypothetical protein H6P81_019530 [Aristolochia fimbriata]
MAKGRVYLLTTLAKRTRHVLPWDEVAPPVVISPTKISNLPNLATIFEDDYEAEENSTAKR